MSVNQNPGCFGSALCYAENADPCLSCNYSVACKPAAVARAESLRLKFGINSISAMTRKPIIRTATTTAPVVQFSPNKKAQEFIAAFGRRGIDLREEVIKKVNPFKTTTPVFMRVGIDLLLKEGLQRNTLKTALMKELSWSESSATSHVGIIFNVLIGAGAVDIKGSTLTAVTL